MNFQTYMTTSNR